MKAKEQINPDVSEEFSHVPVHVAIIMDGNGRWAEQRSLPRLAGHQAGRENIRRVIEEAARIGVKHLTIYAFSTENWDRPVEEVNGLMGILGEAVETETSALHKQGVRLCHLGTLDRLPPELRKAVCRAVELTKNNDRITLNVAFNYGGRAEILGAVRRIVEEGVAPKDIDEVTFSSYLNTAGMPEPDLIIRTGGEMRLSNFLLWQSAYSEYYSTEAYWPDFDQEELHLALKAYGRRRRRFGRVEA
ncbi:MAG: isoprenyl transferase [Chloroflexota bacterium]|nr:isoprenyl transferase [Chloroflexota bacterium]MDE2940859.1 isoprenyl transferase [Chloroflexota bacterium]MDE3267551.1 isoprenyl transferase [Chloroflexota bacterium]